MEERMKRYIGRFDRARLRGMQRVLRWPIVFVVVLYSALLLWVYASIRITVYVMAGMYEFVLNFMYWRRKRLVELLRDAKSYNEWAAVARELDEFNGSERWKATPESSLYDHFTVESLMDRLNRGIAKIDRGEPGYARDMMETLLTVYNSNLNGLGVDNEAIYSETYHGTKHLIEDFVQLVVLSTMKLMDAPEREVSTAQKKDFFAKAQRSYGRMAVCLSSGAMMANYHFGTIKALSGQGLLPQIISGTSGGSFVAAFVCTRSDEELGTEITPELWRIIKLFDGPMWKAMLRMVIRGEMVRTSFAVETLRAVFGDITFEEAFQKTGRILCVTATSSKKFGDTILLNHATAPNVTIWSAILASSAVPPVLKPMQLYAKNTNTGEVEPFRDFGLCWTDGAFRRDVPRKQLSETFNVNYLVVSQTNPHIIPFFFDSRGSSGHPSLRSKGSGYRGGFILSSLEALLRLEMLKMMKFIDEFDLLPYLFSADFSRVFLQRYTGDVTVYPKRGISLIFDILRVLIPPDHEAMRNYIQRGEFYSWPKLCRIRNHLVLEQTLIKCARLLEEE